MPLILGVWLAACVHPGVGKDTSGHPPTAGSDTDTVETPTTTPTGPSATTDLPVTLKPSVTVLGTSTTTVATKMGLLPAANGDPGVIFVYYDDVTDDVIAQILLIAGAIPAGEHELLALWDGVSWSDLGLDAEPVPAGDVNHDGHADLWWGADLFLGPFLGRDLHWEGGVAHIGTDGGWAKDGAFDADDDGQLDVMATSGQLRAYIYYGPFDGPIEKAGRTTSYSQLGAGLCYADSGQAVVVRDAQGPGHDAVAVGMGIYGGIGGCEPTAEIYDLQVPPGTFVRDEDRLAAVWPDGPVPFDAVGDLDGDGFGDLVYGDELDGWVYAGPFGAVDDANAGRMVLELQHGHAARGLGDVDGDGIEDLLVWVEPDQLGAEPWWGVLFSPYPPVVDLLTSVVPLQDYGGGGIFYWKAGDLDGDGLSDVVNHGAEKDFPERGDIRIWYATDLLAARSAYTNVEGETP